MARTPRRGTLVVPDDKPLAAVLVILRHRISGFNAETTTGRDGSFRFFHVPFNPYELHIDTQGFAAVHKSVNVRNTIPANLEVKLDLPAVSESVSVQLQFMVLNAFDVQGLYDILSTVGGTHVIPPRRFVDQVQLAF